MQHLNYNHLLYFWSVAREGSIARASESLHLTPQTISGQLKQLEARIGAALFQRVGRGLVLTETGQLVKEYADEIFTLGHELAQRVRSGQPHAPEVLHVGVVNSIAKLIAYRILEPALETEDDLRVVCHEAGLEKLLGELAVHRLDVVLSDRPVPTGLNVRAYNHLLGQSGIAFFAHKRLAARHRRGFPGSLHRAPVLLPDTATALRRSLEDWFDAVGVAPRIVAEFDDSALLKAFGQAGAGLFPAPDAIAAQVETMYQAARIGTVDGMTEAYYAISPERKLKHPAVLRITERARARLFG